MISAIKNFFYKIIQKFVLLFGLIIILLAISLIAGGAKYFNDTFSSDPIQGTFNIEKAEIIVPNKTVAKSGRKKRTRTKTDGTPYLSIKLFDENGSKLHFSYKDVKTWKWVAEPPVGLNNIRAAILNAGSVNVEYRKGMLFSKIIDEVALNP